MSVTDSRNTELYYDTDEGNIFDANWSHLADTDLLLHCHGSDRCISI